MLNNNPLVKGILIGVGVSVVGFCAYKHNEDKVDDFLRRHGVNVKSPAAGFETMSVEDLMRTKETIEDVYDVSIDLIAYEDGFLVVPKKSQ